MSDNSNLQNENENQNVDDLPLITSFTRTQMRKAYHVAWETFALTGGNHFLVCEAVKNAFPQYRIHSPLIDRIFIDVQADIVKERNRLRRMLANLAEGFAELYSRKFW